MVWFLICSATALLITARSVVNLFHDRFPHPVDVASISICYYGVPLSIAGYFDLNYDHMVFLANFAADQGLAALSMQFIALSLIALQCGRMIGVRVGPAKLTRFATVNTFARERVRFILIGLIALIILGIYLFGLQEFMSGYAMEGTASTGSTGNAVIYAAIEFLGLTIAYAMIIGLVTGKIPLKFLILASIIILLAILAIRAKRLEIVSAFIPSAVILLSGRSTLNSASWKVIVGGASIFVLVVVSAVRTAWDINFGQGVFLFLSEGLYAGHSLPGIVERLHTYSLSYEHGVRFINALVGFVPRFLWEGKDDMVYAGNLALEGVAPLGATSFLAEVVLQGGLVAVAICYTLMGFVFERIIRFRDIWDASLKAGVIPARCGAYLIAIAIFIPHFRDGIIPAVKLTLQASVFFAILSGMRLIGKKTIAIESETQKHSESDLGTETVSR